MSCPGVTRSMAIAQVVADVRGIRREFAPGNGGFDGPRCFVSTCRHKPLRIPGAVLPTSIIRPTAVVDRQIKVRRVVALHIQQNADAIMVREITVVSPWPVVSGVAKCRVLSTAHGKIKVFLVPSEEEFGIRGIEFNKLLLPQWFIELAVEVRLLGAETAIN